MEWLTELSLPADAELIAGLELPQERISDPGELKAVWPVLAHLRKQWVSLTVVDDPQLQLVGDSNPRDGNALFWKVFGKLAIYLAYLVRFAASEDPVALFNWIVSDDQRVSPKFGEREAKKLVHKLKKAAVDAEGGSEEAEREARKLHMQMGAALASTTAALQILAFDRSFLPLVFLRTMQKLSANNESDLIDSSVEAESLAGLRDLNAGIGKLGGSLSRLQGGVVEEILRYGEFVYRERDKLTTQKAVESAFSDRWLDELHLLSKRSPVLTEKYGAKQVEKRFERHLALLLQTFGFVTVPALSGEPAADLLCIGGDGEERFTILVDAKSSKRPYVLPKDDQRALLDYIRETLRTLSDLPPLKLALIVGHGPAGTVGDKLAKLEADANLPLRFVAAKDLAAFRRRFDGSLRLDLLLDVLLNGNSVLSTEDWDKLFGKHADIQKTYSEFVRGMRSVKGG